MTNILDIALIDGQQPNKTIDVQMPIASGKTGGDICILATSKDDPTTDDWEIIEAEMDNETNCLRFSIKHFSM